MIQAILIGIFALIIIILYLIVKSRSRSQSKSKIEEQQSKEIQQKDTKIKTQQKSNSISDETKTQKKRKKKKKQEDNILKNNKQLEEHYTNLFYGVLSLKANNSMSLIDAVQLKNSKILLSNSKNELVLFDLKRWKKDSPCQDRFFTSLDNNQGSAVAIGNKYYYVALTFQKTIAYYEFLGGENGIYFRQVKKFARNLYKSDISSLYVPENQRFIVGTGSGSDTVINVWSINGDKLAQVNTYQIEHYNTCYGSNKILVRGWTSEVKLFQIVTDKNGQFVKLDKSHHLTHSEQASCSAIDNLGLYAVTVSSNDLVKLWAVYSPQGHLTQKTASAYKLQIENPTLCAVHTLRDDSDRLRTFVVLATNNKAVICDRQFNVIQILQGLQISGLYLTGSAKSAVLGTYSSAGKLTIWNISSLLQKIKGYVIS